MTTQRDRYIQDRIEANKADILKVLSDHDTILMERIVEKLAEFEIKLLEIKCAVCGSSTLEQRLDTMDHRLNDIDHRLRAMETVMQHIDAGINGYE